MSVWFLESELSTCSCRTIGQQVGDRKQLPPYTWPQWLQKPGGIYQSVFNIMASVFLKLVRHQHQH